MALSGDEGNTATASVRPESGRNAREIAGDRPNKRRADDGEISPTGVHVLLGATEAHTPGVKAHAPGVPRAPVAPQALAATEGAKSAPTSAAGIPRPRQRRRPVDRDAPVGPDTPVGPDVQVAPNFTTAQLQQLLSLLQQQAPAVTEEIATPNATSVSAKSEKAKTESVKHARTKKTGRGEDTRAAAAPVMNNPIDSDNKDDDDGEAHALNAAFAPVEQLPPLPSPNPTLTAASFKNAAVREQAEVLEHLRAYLKHAEHKVRHNEPESALEYLGEVFTLITNRFKLLHVADYTNFRTANRFKLYEDKSVFTSRPFKQAVADVAAMERAQGNFNRTPRGGGRGPMAFGNQRGPPFDGNGRSFRGSCFRCGQPGHMANACPENRGGAQGPAPVV
ncbi:unnamed protein product [Closterium sp. NIES-54]